MTKGVIEGVAMLPEWVLNTLPKKAYTPTEALVYLYTKGTDATGLIRETIRGLATVWQWSKSGVGRFIQELVGQGKAIITRLGYVLSDKPKQNGTKHTRRVGQTLGQKKRIVTICKSDAYRNAIGGSWDKSRDAQVNGNGVSPLLSYSYGSYSLITPVKNEYCLNTYSINNTSNIIKNINNNKLIKQEKSSKVINTKNGMAKEKKDYSLDFEAFWEISIRKEDKQAALKHYVRIVKSGVTVERIQDSWANYNEYHREKGTDRTYVKKPFNWLSGGGYENEPMQIAGKVAVIELSALTDGERREYEQIPSNYKKDAATGLLRRKNNFELAGLD